MVPNRTPLDAIYGEVIVDKLINHIHIARGLYYKDLDVIVMHPLTCKAIFDHNKFMGVFKPDMKLDKYYFMGIKILRSVDVEEGEFVVR